MRERPRLVTIPRPGRDELGREATKDRDPVVEKSASCATCGTDLWPDCTGHCCEDGFVEHDAPGEGGVAVA